MSLDHASHATCRIVEQTSLLLVVQQWLELAENDIVVAEDLLLVVALLAQQTCTVSGVAADLGVLVTDPLEQDLHELTRVWCDTVAHVANAFGNGTNGVAPFHLLLAASVLDDWLLEDLPQLTKVWSECSCQTGDELHRRLDDEPVVLGGLGINILLILTI